MDSITINGVEYVPTTKAAKDSDGRKFVIARCSAAGVHCGYLVDFDAATATVTLTNSRRMWKWHGRTLSGMAVEGTDNAALCKFGDPLDEIVLLGVCELITCTEAAAKSLLGVAKWVNS